MQPNDLPAKSVQETMLGPFWARAIYSQKYPRLLDDKEAVRILGTMDRDFSGMDTTLGEWRSIGLLARARAFDDGLRSYMNSHPRATVINLGAGLDTTFSRVDNGSIRWHDLDLPGAIAFRKHYIPETARSTCIALSAFDTRWFDAIEYTKENGIFIIAGGLLYYFTTEEVKSLLTRLADRFSGGELVCDVVSRLAAAVANRRASKIPGAESVRFRFTVGNPVGTFEPWSRKLKVKRWEAIGQGTPIYPAFSKETRKMIRLTRWLKTGKIVHLEFVS